MHPAEGPYRLLPGGGLHVIHPDITPELLAILILALVFAAVLFAAGMRVIVKELQS